MHAAKIFLAWVSVSWQLKDVDSASRSSQAMVSKSRVSVARIHVARMNVARVPENRNIQAGIFPFSPKILGNGRMLPCSSKTLGDGNGSCVPQMYLVSGNSSPSSSKVFGEQFGELLGEGAP